MTPRRRRSSVEQMQRQPMPPIIQEMFRQLKDESATSYSRENVCQRLEDVLHEITAEVVQFRKKRTAILTKIARSRG